MSSRSSVTSFYLLSYSDIETRVKKLEKAVERLSEGLSKITTNVQNIDSIVDTIQKAGLAMNDTITKTRQELKKVKSTKIELFVNINADRILFLLSS